MANYAADSLKETRGFSTAASWAAFLTFDLIVLGSLVRATDSGLSCPDWPLCYDQLVPVMDMQIFVEWLHRLSALVLAGVLSLLVYKLIKHQHLRRMFSAQIYTALGLFIVQCVLGGLTVLHLLDPTVVSLHLINAVLFYSLLVWVAFRAHSISAPTKQTIPIPPYSQGLKTSLIVFSAVIFGQLLLGAMVASNHAGLACTDFPKCNDEWLPNGSYLFTLQMSHRIVAFLILAMGMIISPWIRTVTPSSSRLRLAARGMVTLILLQGLLGIINVFHALPTWASVAHMGNGLAIYSILLLITLRICSSKQAATEARVPSEGTKPALGNLCEENAT